jgi:predicted chitinase
LNQKSPLSEENLRAAVATIIIETAHTFAPIKEYGDRGYFVRNYWASPRTRQELGNILPDDAFIYCGRGFIQITGRANYEHCAGALNLPLMSQPELLLQADPSARAMAWFWQTHGLIHACDNVKQYSDQQSRDKAWAAVRKIVNGGTNGLAMFLDLLGKLEIR